MKAQEGFVVPVNKQKLMEDLYVKIRERIYERGGSEMHMVTLLSEDGDRAIDQLARVIVEENPSLCPEQDHVSRG